jgi:hypothetical protein
MSLVKRGKHGVSTYKVNSAYPGYTMFCTLYYYSEFCNRYKLSWL